MLTFFPEGDLAVIYQSPYKKRFYFLTVEHLEWISSKKIINDIKVFDWLSIEWNTVKALEFIQKCY